MEELIAQQDLSQLRTSLEGAGAVPTGAVAAAALAAMALSACGGGSPAPPAPMLDLASAKRDTSLFRASPLAAAQSNSTAAFDATALMNWAENAYPGYFPSHQPDLVYAPYIYRYYPENGTYLGVAGNDVYVIGPITNDVLLWVGTLASFSCSAHPASCAAGPATALDAARFLAQATHGASKADIAAMQATTYAAWVDTQIAMPRSQTHYDWLVEHGFSAEDFRNSTQGLDNTIWHKLITAPDSLRQRVTLALSEILVVSVSGVNTAWRQFAVANYLDILEANAFGNYRTLLDQVSLSTAMGYYLTFRGNTKANVNTGSQPDENYARELMQLFTVGLLKLNSDGTPSGGETYVPADVSGLARVFTGWDVDTSGYVSPFPPDIHKRPMTQVPNRYETGAKTFLGVTIASGTSARDSLTLALDTLFNHPNLPPFVSRQLIQRLVTSNPSPTYVARVAAVFTNNGAGVRGDLAAVVKAILLDTEARDPANASSAEFGKLREPVVRFLNWARGFGATSPGDLWAIGDVSDPGARLGQSPMRSPSVFNFFRPGYVPPTSSIAAQGLVAPEFQITTESSVAGYINYMQRAVNGVGIGDVRADYTALVALATDSAALLAEINLVLAAGQVPAARLATLKTALDTINPTTDAGKLNRVKAALTLVLAAPEYIAQK
ncbi:DUF1800 domain-containing protein [Caenimonas koreensis]|nr:DUF1800 domain-containing protein [Caenimonas koreensis]